MSGDGSRDTHYVKGPNSLVTRSHTYLAEALSKFWSCVSAHGLRNVDSKPLAGPAGCLANTKSTRCDMNRRLVLKMLAATALSDFAISAAASAEDQILELDCNDLLARIRDGSLRAEQVCARFLQQYER